MPGPFLEYTEPNVYTRTLNDQTVATLTGGLRVPLLIGVGSETLTLTDQEIIRGSSAVADNYMDKEDVSAQLNGQNRDFTVSKYPIVSGDGTGTISNNPTNVTVYLNGDPVGVAQLFGSIGKVVLSVIPRLGDEVVVNYYFKRTDTLISDENLSKQADGVNTLFYVFNVPIVDGTNGGIATTDVSKVSVKVNGLSVSVASVDGQSGTITLMAAPAAGATVLFTYWTNTWQDTFDYLPVQNIVNVVRVGTAPGRSDYTNLLDFVIEGNTIQWGNSFSIISGATSPNTTAFGNTQINAYLYDNKVYARPTAGVSDGLNKVFELEYIPTEGTGKGIPTHKVNLLSAYVGVDVTNALLNEVDILEVSPYERKLTLRVAPLAGDKVFVTYWHNFISDDVFTYTSVVPSTTFLGGTFVISSVNNGDLAQILEDRPSDSVWNSNFDIEGVTYPTGGFDGQTIPGYSVEETVLVNFVDAYNYLVISSLGPDGSAGSGVLGQTYIDQKTGIRFTIMQPTTFDYRNGDLLEYDISKTFKTSGYPYYAVPGLKITTASTLGVAAGNTAVVSTFNKSGLEPKVGDFYYVTLNYAKTSYPISIYTKIKDVTSFIGPVNTSNRLSLAAYLAFQNGAVALALAQVLRDPSGVDASSQAYIDVLKQVESPLRDTGTKPDIICPITTKSDVINEARLHCEKLSTIRYKSERTSVFGFPVGTTPEKAQQFAKSMKSDRLVGIYPDGAVVSLVDEFGNSNDAVVDGSFLAAAYSGLAVNPIYDVATPMTNKTLVGFKRLYRQMDSVAMNQTAVAGLTVLEEAIPNLLIRQALTTDPSTVLTREPSVIYIKDLVQQQIRAALKKFIGIKFLSTVLQDIEVTASNVMTQLQNLSIITAFADVTAVQDPNDPTICQIEIFYSPVFPLNWIVVQFNLRVRI